MTIKMTLQGQGNDLLYQIRTPSQEIESSSETWDSKKPLKSAAKPFQKHGGVNEFPRHACFVKVQ